MNEAKFYMQRIDKGLYDIIDIEKEFPGLHYLKMEGVNNVGKPKNVYTERYADSNTLRVYLPDDANYANDPTTINFTFLISGNALERQTTYDNFINYIRVGIHRYKDTVRNRTFDFIVDDEIVVSDEKWCGNNPYIEVTIKLKNINGKTELSNG